MKNELIEISKHRKHTKIDVLTTEYALYYFVSFHVKKSGSV